MVREIIFFAYVRNQGITEHMCNMALAISRYINLLVVYNRTIEVDSQYLEKLKDNNIACIDVSELSQHIATHFATMPLLFHSHGFSHLRVALKNARPIDKVIITVHCFRNARWWGKWVSLLTYSLFSQLVDMWHFLSCKSREEYFWFKTIPANSCVYPLGVERSFMTRSSESCVVKDLDRGEITDLSERVNIVCIARFYPWKRHIYLLRSLRSILKGNTYLILVGEGPLLKKIMDFAKELGIRDHVIFTGKIDRKTVHYVLCNANLSVTVSSSETFGWCILEPFCMDVPIVTTNVGIANSIINDFRNGFIVDVNCEEEEFRNKVKYALEHIQDVDNSSMKNLYSWQTFSATMKQCYDYVMDIR